MKKATREDKDELMEGASRSNGEDLQDTRAERNMSEVEEQLNIMVGDLQRTRADFENYRKQVELQKATAMKATQLATVHKVLPLLDDIERAIVTYPKELSALSGSLAKTLKELGLKKIEVSGEFNPDLHEAVMSEGEGEKEVVSEVLRTGYYYEGEVLRPSMVKVKKI